MPNAKLFVGNLPYATTEQDLRDLFAGPEASVQSVRVVTDLDTGRSKGYGFVELATTEEASEAIKRLNGFNLNGRPIVVSEARSRAERPPRPGR